MSIQSILVPPATPTPLSPSSPSSPSRATRTGDPNVLLLAEYDLWMTFIINVYLIQAEIDVDKFATALEKVAGVFRHVSGRLVSNSDGWKIRLSQSPVPVDVVTVDQLPPLDGDWVVQNNLTPFLRPKTTSVVNSNTPLLALRLTKAPGRTAIGISWHHTLGDATMLLRFMHHLSQAYQDQPFSYPAPRFTKHMFPVASAQTMERFRPLMPHLTEAIPAADAGQIYGQRNRYTTRVSWFVEKAKAEALRDAMNARNASAAEGERFSLQDCMSAYVATLLNRCGRKPIDKITNATSYRKTQGPFHQPDRAGNSIFVVPTEQFGESESLDICAIARRIRTSLRHAANPSFVESYMSVAAVYMLAAANEGRQFFYGVEPSVLSVNSHIHLDWTSAHFGSPPNSTKFFTSGVSKYYLRVFRANPSASGEGFDISFGVPLHMESRVKSTLREDFASAEWPNNVIDLD